MMGLPNNIQTTCCDSVLLKEYIFSDSQRGFPSSLCSHSSKKGLSIYRTHKSNHVFRISPPSVSAEHWTIEPHARTKTVSSRLPWQGFHDTLYGPDYAHSNVQRRGPRNRQHATRRSDRNTRMGSVAALGVHWRLCYGTMWPRYVICDLVHGVCTEGSAVEGARIVCDMSMW